MILKALKQFFDARRGQKNFDALSQVERKIVFYSEDVYSMAHFEPLIKRLHARYGESCCYLTSAIDDPVLSVPLPGMRAFYIGEGVIRSAMFRTLKAGMLIMTMPDLDNYHIKRSQVFPVHYVYLFHAMVSTHSNYRKGAFDHFDSIFCTGPFQIDEIRATEKVYGLKAKALYADGYRRLEAIIADVDEHRRTVGGPTTSGPKTIIVAPSWGEDAILESCGEAVVKVLLDAGYNTIVRPHPMTAKHRPEILDSLISCFGSHERFLLQLDIQDNKTLYESHVMISDWSGVALEYAFACERPVVFLDLPKKCNNPEADRIPLVPVEVSLREKIGRVISPEDINGLPDVIEKLHDDNSTFIESIRKIRNDCVFNLDGSLDKAVDELMDISRRIEI